MAALFIIVTAIVVTGISVHHICILNDLQFLCSQIKELENGSQIELCVQSRQPHVLALCKKLNDLQRMHNDTYVRYEKAQKHLKQNITGLAHDIRTPLTGAVGYVQLAQECEQSVQRERYLKTALGRMQELEDMLEELFLYTKLTSEELKPKVCQIQVLPLLSTCLIGMYAQFEEKEMVPNVNFASESFCVLADEEYLRRIFRNLLHNALLHGEGELNISQTDNCLRFENTITESDRPDPDRIFERFYKADSARRKGSSGLGLFIVKELAEKMNAGVRAQLIGDKFCIILEWKSGFL